MTVQDYLEQKRRQENAEKAIKQKMHLEKLGLYDVVYAPNSEPSAEYPEHEVDARTGEVRYFKRVPARVTPEQYAEICRYSSQKESKSNILKELTSGSIISTFLFAAGIALYIIGLILGFVMGKQTVAVSFFEVQTKFYIWNAVIYWVLGFAGGTLFIGLARIVQLLEENQKKDV